MISGTCNSATMAFRCMPVLMVADLCASTILRDGIWKEVNVSIGEISTLTVTLFFQCNFRQTTINLLQYTAKFPALISEAVTMKNYIMVIILHATQRYC